MEHDESDQTVSKGFFSYVHEDDEAEGGRIRQLAQHIMAEYKLISGRDIELFRDYKDLSWGDDWVEQIKSSINEVDFFIPIITPSYLKSKNCRDEFELVRKLLEEAGAKKLIFPIVYIAINDKHGPLMTDPIWLEVQRILYEDWDELRFEDPTSKPYRTRIHKCAVRLLSLSDEISAGRVISATTDNARIQAMLEATARVDHTTNTSELEALSDGFESLTAFAPTLNLITEDINLMGDLVSRAELKANMPASTPINPFKQRLVVLRDLAVELIPIGARILENGQSLWLAVGNIDVYIRKIAELSEQSQEAIELRQESKNSLTLLADSSNQSSEQIQMLIANMAIIEKQSREIRQPIEDIRYGLNLIIEANRVIQEWKELF